MGSLSNIADDGFAAEEGRAMIQEYDISSGQIRPFATGLRNPVGTAWTPEGTLFTVVNERDGLGDETPAGLSDLGRRGRVLWLALLLLGQDCR